MPVTLKDIAARSGYSITTVSRALGGFSDVNVATRERILTIAAEMGYEPNSVARQLQGRRTNTIGLIIPAAEPRIDDDFFSLLLKGISHAASRFHHDVLISTQLPGGDEMDAYRRIAGGRRVDGMIVARTRRSDPRIEYLRCIDHPFVVAGRAAPDVSSDFPYIDADSQQGIRLLVEHFAAYGHRNIGLILPPAHLAYTAYREAGYREGLQAANLPYRAEYVNHGELTTRSGEDRARALLDAAPEITAIIACNDIMALGAMQAIQGRGLRVGLDIALGGFDDLPIARLATPTLTTVRQPIYEIGERLTALLLDIIASEPTTPPSELITPQLIVRESSGTSRNSV